MRVIYDFWNNLIIRLTFKIKNLFKILTMQFSEKWLRTLVSPDLTSDALATLLTMSGLEVDTMENITSHFSNVLIGEVLQVNIFPFLLSKSVLKICCVDVNIGTTLKIISHASNIYVGMKVPVAPVGATLSFGHKKSELCEIKIQMFNGVESHGLLCSFRMLQLSEDNDNLLELPKTAPIGKDFYEYYFSNDLKFTLKLTPNRADCLSLIGIAREVSALTNTQIQYPSYTKIIVNDNKILPVKVLATKLCGRFVGRIIRGLNFNVATPIWMQQRLQCSGQKLVSVFTDISNYVMLECGSPFHILDLDKICGNLYIRWGCVGESVKLLNNVVIELNESIGVIADEQKIESLAGIIGSDVTKVSFCTRNIYLQTAFWIPEAIQTSINYYKFTTDAAHRFERGVDFENIIQNIERITSLLFEICGCTNTKISPIDDHIVDLPKRQPINVRTARISKIIGTTAITDEVITNIFTRLKFNFIKKSDHFVVIPPSFRFDITLEEDLIEEVARLYGFENIPSIPPLEANIVLMNVASEQTRSLFSIRYILANLGYQEVINYSFVSDKWEIDFCNNKNPIRLLNPISDYMNVMRSSLIASLVANAKYNMNHKVNRIRIFEIGTVFFRDNKVQDSPLNVHGYNQPKRIAGLVCGPVVKEQWGEKKRNVDFFDVKADLEMLYAPCVLRFVAIEHYSVCHPRRAANIFLNGKLIGVIGELHPFLQQKYDLPITVIIFELYAQELQARIIPTFTNISKYPIVTRDLALIVKKSTPVQALLDIFNKTKDNNPACAIIRHYFLLDKYYLSESNFCEASFTFRFTLQGIKNTLHVNEINAVIRIILNAVTSCNLARLRS